MREVHHGIKQGGGGSKELKAQGAFGHKLGGRKESEPKEALKEL